MFRFRYLKWPFKLQCFRFYERSCRNFSSTPEVNPWNWKGFREELLLSWCLQDRLEDADRLFSWSSSNIYDGGWPGWLAGALSLDGNERKRIATFSILWEECFLQFASRFSKRVSLSPRECHSVQDVNRGEDFRGFCVLRVFLIGCLFLTVSECDWSY